MGFQHMSVRARLSSAFGLLAFLVLVASAVAIRGLNEADRSFVSFVNGINARALLATSIRSGVDARAIAARNLVLVSKPADVEIEKAAVAQAHAQVQSSLAKLKEMVAAEDIPANGKAQVAEIDRVEKAYTPVALGDCRSGAARQAGRSNRTHR